jgi:hypothetical protein|tara:strand:- start:13 stop:309 length:297 start_codon:yes stop_codon:yes gene_type:complete
MSKRRKKSKFKHAVVGKKKYYFYKIRWIDITGDAGHKTEEEMNKLECCILVSQGFIHNIDRKKKTLTTFASYDEKEPVFSDTNIFPLGCILSKEKVRN